MIGYIIPRNLWNKAAGLIIRLIMSGRKSSTESFWKHFEVLFSYFLYIQTFSNFWLCTPENSSLFSALECFVSRPLSNFLQLRLVTRLSNSIKFLKFLECSKIFSFPRFLCINRQGRRKFNFWWSFNRGVAFSIFLLTWFSESGSVGKLIPRRALIGSATKWHIQSYSHNITINLKK